MKFETLVLATRNRHKSEELRAMLSGLRLSIQDMNDHPACPEVEEDGETLEENALKKARETFRCTGRPCAADDTGLEVYYLLDQPGVRSARYAGENATYADNNRKLLDELTQVPARRREARFRCVIALVSRDVEQLFEGVMEGTIAFQPRGSNGFGYDPLFIPAGRTETYAELPADEKNRISHRALAMRQLLEFLKTA